jgi:hypothetical protein
VSVDITSILTAAPPFLFVTGPLGPPQFAALGVYLGGAAGGTVFQGGAQKGDVFQGGAAGGSTFTGGAQKGDAFQGGGQQGGELD